MRGLEKLKETRMKAEQNMQAAEHMLFTAYPVLRDSKLLIAVIENIFLAMSNAMAYVLYNERISRRIPPFHENYESKLQAFRNAIGSKMSSYIELMEELKEIILEHRKSPVEFTRKEGLVICSENYRMKVIFESKVKEYASRARAFLKETGDLVKNERKSA